MRDPYHDPALPPWQFRLTAEDGGFSCATGAGTEVVELRDADDAPAGWLFGYPIDLDGKTMLTAAAPHRLAQHRGEDTDAFAEAVLSSLGGRFTWLFVTDGVARIYLDCGGSVPVVYDPEAKIAGTTATAILRDDEYEDRFDRALYDAMRIDRDGYFPAGLTAHRGVIRLLPNHYLDLETWMARRHWPDGPIPKLDDPDAGLDRLIATLRGQLEALIAGPQRVAQALTAGQETRMLLGVARPYRDQIDFVTVVGGDRHAIDSIMSRKIAAEEGLSHRELTRVRSSAEERDALIRRGGHAIAEANSWYAPSILPIAESHRFFGGAGGELARGFFWQPGDTDATEITPDRLTDRLGQPRVPALRDAMAQWIAGLPQGISALDVLDLAYVEHRMGPWSGAQFCNDPTLVRYAPLMTVPTARIMLGLPDDWKRQERMAVRVLEKTWPELGRFPYNSAGWFRDRLSKLQRVLSDPGLILRKLRKRRK